MLGLDQTVLGVRDRALAREWVLPNGRGGYAAASVAGAMTRASHGLLVGALGAADDRVLAVGQLEAWAEAGGHRIPLHTAEYPGVVSPDSGPAAVQFALDGMMPVTRWRVGEATVEQRVWTEHGKNTAYVAYEVAGEAVRLHVAPLVTLRSIHDRTHGFAHWHFHRWGTPGGLALEAFPDAPPLLLLTEPEAPLQGDAVWYWQLHHRWEARRGYPAEEDLYCPGAWDVYLAHGQRFTIILSLEAADTVDRNADAAIARFRERAAAVVARAGRDFSHDPFARQLVLAADSFVVEGPQGLAVLAGYPWHGALTRETLIALPGLLLTTGRSDVAAGLLRTLAGRFREGLLPDSVSGWGSDSYTNADAALWWFAALDAYVAQTDDLDLVREVSGAAEGAFRALAGVDGRPGRLRMDRDGLLTFAPDTGLTTWMNAHAFGSPVTPRAGKPVEINALWHHAVMALARWGERTGRRIQGLSQLAARIRQAFNARFWYAAGGHLYDVLDGPGGDDASLRPNQVLAIALPDAVLDPARQRAVVERVTADLATPLGLRTLSPHDPRYRGYYEGDANWRESAAHQGSVWPWLLGPYVDAALRVGMDPLRLRTLFTGLQTDLARGALGTIGEVYDGVAPHLGGGAPSYAASVGEVLRAWLRLQDANAA